MNEKNIEELLIKASIILKEFSSFEYKGKKKNKSSDECHKLIDRFLKDYSLIYIDNINLFIKISFDSENAFSDYDKCNLLIPIRRKSWDIVLKILYISKFDVKERGLFILGQFLRTVFVYSNLEVGIYNNTNESEEIDAGLRQENKNFLKSVSFKFPNTIGVSKTFLKKKGLDYPLIKEMFFDGITVYSQKHKSNLVSEDLYKEYSDLSEWLHGERFSNLSKLYSNPINVVSGIMIPTRIIIQSLNTYFYNNKYEELVEDWIVLYDKVQKEVVGSWKESINI